MKSPSLKAMISQADKLYQQKYLQLNPTCLICGKPAHCIHHFIYKSHSKALRYDENNGISICISCHSRHHLSGDPYIVATILKVKGQEWNNSLQEKRKERVKFNKAYMKGIIEKLQ